MAPHNISADFDFLDPDVNLVGLPVTELAQLRESEPIHWVDIPGGSGGFEDKGYWIVSKHADVKEVSRRSDVFSSWQNGAIPSWPPEMKREQVELQRSVMLNMDAPHHTRLRKIISRGFTPRAVGRLEEELAQRAQNIAKAAAAEGTGDFVEQVSCELPLQAIASLLGVPQEDRDKLFRWSNEMTGGEDPEYAEVDPAQSSMELIMYAMAMADERGKNPTDDIVTTLIQADLDGEKLSDDEFGFFVIMLAVAGNETTRNSITHGMIAFANNPDQWELYKKERPSTTADEIIRWATPVSAFQRTANEDVELAGVQIKQGQRVVMSYRSANFDEEVFEDPHAFNILRDPNPHVGFGGTGAHYCIGANLAKMTINLIFNAVADNMPDLKPISAPQRRGGDGVGLPEIATALTEIGRHGLVGPALATLGLGAVLVLDLASDEQQARYLGGLAKGSLLTAALNEPGTALPERPATTFVHSRLSGTKVGVGYAENAEWMIVTADSAVVVVSPKADGVHLAKTPTSNGSDEYVVTFADVAVPEQDVLIGATTQRVNQLALAALGAYAAGLVAGALRLTADYVANRHQFGKPLSTFQTVAAQLAEVYIASRTIDLASTSVIWRLSEGRDADEDLDVLGYWVTSQAPPVMQICHHLHGGMGMDVTYPMHRYYSTIKDLTRLLGGPSHRLDLVGAQCSST